MSIRIREETSEDSSWWGVTAVSSHLNITGKTKRLAIVFLCSNLFCYSAGLVKEKELRC